MEADGQSLQCSLQLGKELVSNAVVPGVQEIEELLGALLLRLGPGGHPGVAQLQPLPRLGALLRLLAVLPQGGQGVHQLLLLLLLRLPSAPGTSVQPHAPEMAAAGQRQQQRRRLGAPRGLRRS